jgi:hypothetical protein
MQEQNRPMQSNASHANHSPSKSPPRSAGSQFMITSSPVVSAVPNVQAFHVVAGESLADIGVVVNAHHHPALAAPHELGHRQVLLEREVHAVPLGFPIRRIHVVEGVRPVVTLDTFQPGQVLDIHSGQPLPRRGEVLLDAPKVCPATLPPKAWCCR